MPTVPGVLVEMLSYVCTSLVLADAILMIIIRSLCNHPSVFLYQHANASVRRLTVCGRPTQHSGQHTEGLSWDFLVVGVLPCTEGCPFPPASKQCYSAYFLLVTQAPWPWFW